MLIGFACGDLRLEKREAEFFEGAFQFTREHPLLFGLVQQEHGAKIFVHHLRLLNQLDEADARPVIGRRRRCRDHRDRRSKQYDAGHFLCNRRRAIDDDDVVVVDELLDLAVDLAAGFGKVHDRKRDAGLAIGGGAGPVNEGVLAVGVNDQDAPPFFVECGAEVHRNGALADTALLLSDCNDFSCQFSLLF
ncbi:hypothetical protein X989_5798 [Burkholderia pseudomallei MSHR4378]|nr:hypothetical protein X989_5798 [Burkholderia pseudomallei MSHR4378]